MPRSPTGAAFSATCGAVEPGRTSAKGTPSKDPTAVQRTLLHVILDRALVAARDAASDFAAWLSLDGFLPTVADLQKVSAEFAGHRVSATAEFQVFEGTPQISERSQNPGHARARGNPARTDNGTLNADLRHQVISHSTI